MKISFSKKTTLSTCMTKAIDGGQQFHLKAISHGAGGGQSSQGLGKATVLLNGDIMVTSSNGTFVGRATSRKEARQMIHAYHCANAKAGNVSCRGWIRIKDKPAFDKMVKAAEIKGEDE